jgi:hypothetical protein
LSAVCVALYPTEFTAFYPPYHAAQRAAVCAAIFSALVSTVLPTDVTDIAAVTTSHEFAFYSAHGSALRCAELAAY